MAISNTLNPLGDLQPQEIIGLLQKLADIKLTQSGFEKAELIVSSLGSKATIMAVVEISENVAELREFAVRLGAFCLPGNGYKRIFDAEYKIKSAQA